MTAAIDNLLAHLSPAETEQPQLEPEYLHWLDDASDEEVEELLRALAERDLTAIDQADLASILRYLVYRLQPWKKQQRRRLPASTVDLLADMYRGLGPEVAPRCYALQMLSSSAGERELKTFADLVVSDPPEDAAGAMLGFGPLFQHTDYDATCLFPKLLDAIAHQAVAVPVVDLANFLVRHELLTAHPGAARKQALMALLGGIVQRLGQIEEAPDKFAASREQLMQQIDESVALAVALCDALAWIGDEEAIAKLYQAFQVRHRRLHTEAAAALARFGEEEGEKALVALASEPVARLRVLAYADELGMADQIDERYRSAASRAEAELALWLAQPAQMGIPPTRLELVDSREQYWPGFDDPVECFLFRFSYRVGENEYNNIGMGGPLTYAFAADLEDLPPDDIYAAFAGWHAEHEDIYELPVEALVEGQRVEMSRLERRLRDEGLTAIEPALLGMFLGDKVLVANASREGHTGIAVTDGQDCLWFAQRSADRPITAREAICIYKGRRLLRTFN